jgi:ATP-binding cassette subfamily F protein uup
MTAVIDVRDLRKSFGARTLLDGVALSIHQGEKVGLIGRNGSGKTTLLRVLAGLEGSEEGTIALRRGAVVGYLPQDPQLEPGRTVLESAAGTAEDASIRADDAPRHRVEALLTRLGIGDWDRPVDHLSVGERRRIAVARALLPEPDLLLLDEPTNHLDPDTILWLEETLFDFRGAALVVTHDRYFLDRVVDRMIEIARGRLTSYDGGYTEYLEARAEREAREKVEEAKRLRFLERELAWARRSPPARTGKQKARRQRAKDLAAEQRERERGRTKVAQLEMGEAPRLGSRVLELEAVVCGHGGAPLIDGFSDRLLVGERIGVVGPNGVGKTTLLRVLVGELEPTSGKVEVGENTRIGYLPQTRPLDPEVTVERSVSDSDWVTVGGKTMHLRAYLDRFLFPPEVQTQKVRSLSGGERSRLLLARLLLEDFNLLVLDEPTNDLDLETLGILEESLEGFAGCVVVVTHDRYFLDRLATSLWVFEGGGKIRRHHGTWDAYLARRDAVVPRAGSPGKRELAGRAEPGGKPSAASDAGPKRLSFNEQRELVALEPRIAELEEEKDQLSALLGSPEFYQAEAARVSEVTARYKVVETELEGLYGRWVELEERRAGQTNPR